MILISNIEKKRSIILNALSWQLDFSGDKPANEVKELWLSFQKIDKNAWYNAIRAYLQNGTVSDNAKI